MARLKSCPDTKHQVRYSPYPSFRTNLGDLFPLPPCAVFGILNQDAQGSQLIANGITAGKIAGPASLVTLSQQRVDLLVAEGISSHQLRRRLVAPPFLLGPLQGATRNLRIPILEHSEDLIEPP